MYTFILILHLVICLALVGVVLVQSGKGGGLAGGAFGGSAQTVFGGRGATDFFTNATMVLGAAFFITSLTLALMSTGAARSSRSLIQSQARRAAASAPATAPAGGQPGLPGAAPATPTPGQAPAGPAPAGPSPAGTPPPAGGGK